MLQASSVSALAADYVAVDGEAACGFYDSGSGFGSFDIVLEKDVVIPQGMISHMQVENDRGPTHDGSRCTVRESHDADVKRGQVREMAKAACDESQQQAPMA